MWCRQNMTCQSRRWQTRAHEGEGKGAKSAVVKAMSSAIDGKRQEIKRRLRMLTKVE